ncbi:MAG: hypothetical protein RID91_14265, partial [Azospirillaceae bacterium]
MTEHRYPVSALVADYLRGGVGLAVTVLPIALIDLHPAVFWVCLALAALFAVFTARTWARHRTVVVSGEEGIEARGPLGGGIAWADLAKLELRYFSTRRDRGDGWMQLDLAGAGRKLALESTLSEFGTLVDRAAAAARANRLGLSAPTIENLQALGAEVGAGGAGGERGNESGGEADPDGPWVGRWAERARARRAAEAG